MNSVDKLSRVSSPELFQILVDLCVTPGKTICRKCQIKVDGPIIVCSVCNWVICRDCADVYFHFRRGCVNHDFFPWEIDQ